MSRSIPFLTLVLATTLAHASSALAADSYLVRFAPWVQNTATLLEESGLAIENHFPEIEVFEVRVTDKKRFKRQLKVLKDSALYVEKNFKVSIDAIPNDRIYKRQKRLHEMNIERAWDITTGSKDVVVAISDTGISLKHPDLVNRIWKNEKEIPGNGIDDDGNGYVDDHRGWNYLNNKKDPDDDNVHGTHVSGIIGAEGNNETGVTGVNWDVTLMPVKFLDGSGSGTIAGGVATILFATKAGARIINCSWSGAGNSQAIRDAIEYAFNHGTLVVAAAGNSSNSTDVEPETPSSEESFGVLSVASSMISGRLSYFSNVGRFTVDVVAPGQDVVSTAYGKTYIHLSGTSMAAPMVSGVAALMLSVRPDLTPLQLRNGLMNSAQHAKEYERSISTEGEIDAYRAVAQLSEGFQVWPGRFTLEVGKSYPLSAWNAEGEVKWEAFPAEAATIDARGNLTAISSLEDWETEVEVRATDSAGNQATSRVKVRLHPFAVGCGSKEGSAPPAGGAASAAFSILGLPLLAAWIGTRRRRKWR